MEFSLPKKIIAIISKLNDSGYSAHLVGGCVRDMLMGLEPKDWDITTNALPQEVKGVFHQTYDTGLRHGTLTVCYEGLMAEITTWRKDSHYSDHRRPDHILFSQALTEDLMRRDFTMNAIAYHPQQGLTDPFNGISDIKEKLIRCVGNPMQRFSEDALRMLRAVRFSAQLDFVIDAGTLEAIKKLSGDLRYVSRERVSAEINKILVSHHPERLSLLWDVGLGQEIFPGITAMPPRFTEASLALMAPGEPELDRKPPKDRRKVLFLSLLFFLAFGEYAPQHAVKLLKGLKYDNATLNGAKRLLMALMELRTPSLRNVRRVLGVYGREAAEDALRIMGVLNPAIAPSMKGFARLDSPVPALTGADLSKTGSFVGPDIGNTLELLNFCLWERTDINDVQTLMLLARYLQKLKLGEAHPFRHEPGSTPIQ